MSWYEDTGPVVISVVVTMAGPVEAIVAKLTLPTLATANVTSLDVEEEEGPDEEELVDEDDVIL